MKRILSLVLALAMVLSCAAAFAEEAPAMNTYKYWEPEWPIAKDGEKMTVSVAHRVNSSYYVSPEKNWFWCWSEDATGIDFDVRQITKEALAEQKNLMFASDNLPDVLMGMDLTTGELVRYGMIEGQLLDLTPYITPEIMPYLSMWFEKYPEMKTVATAPNGAIYSLPFTKLKSDYYGSHETMAYNMTWLKEVYPDLPEVPDTLEEYEAWVEATKDVLPKTVDEFTELLYAFKKNHPDSTPLGSVNATDNTPMSYLLTAFGYLTTEKNEFGYEVALKDGKPVIPATDPTFIEFLKLANQYYTDGIIAKDYFTADKLVGNTQVTDNQCAVYTTDYIGSILPESEKFHQWDSLYPLTSQWNDQPMAQEVSLYKVGGACLSANAQNVEAILNYLDFFYSDLGIFYMWCGPINGSPDTLGMVEGFYYDVKEGRKIFPDVNNGTYEDSLAFVYGAGMGLSSAFGNRSHSITDESYANMWQTLQRVQGTPDEEINRVELSYGSADNFGRMGSRARVAPYVVEGFPHIVYYTDEQQETIDEITLMLNDYIESEVAKFITGATEITQENFDKFVSECNAYGAADLLEIYTEVYNSYLANK